jgi:hypothetical protein
MVTSPFLPLASNAIKPIKGVKIREIKKMDMDLTLYFLALCVKTKTNKRYINPPIITSSILYTP